MSQEKPKRNWIRRILLGVLVLLVLLVAVRFIVLAPRTVAVVPGPDTTRLTEPLKPDGTIDYTAAITELCRQGVTKDNNAAVVLVGAMGPGAFSSPEQWRKVMTELGVVTPGPNAKFFISWEDYYAKHRPPNAPDDDDASEMLKPLIKPWSAPDAPVVTAWLEANTEPLKQAAAASKRSKYFMPLMLSEKDDEIVLNIEPLVNVRRVANALTVRAALRQGAGQADEGWADLMAAYRLARLVGQNQTLISRLTALRIESNCLETTAAIASGGGLSAQQARKRLEDLKLLEHLPSVIDVIDNGERLFMLQGIQKCRRNGFGWLINVTKTSGEGEPDDLAAVMDAAALDWNEVLRAFNARLDELVGAYRKRYLLKRLQALRVLGKDKRGGYESRTKEFEKIVRRQASQVKLWGSLRRKELSRAVGRLLVEFSMPVSVRATSQYDSTTMKFELTRVAMALAAYKAEKGQYPANLAELRGKYIKETPRDILSSDWPRYKRTNGGYVMYSLGFNMRDDGGKSSGSGADDIVIRVGDADGESGNNQ